MEAQMKRLVGWFLPVVLAGVAAWASFSQRWDETTPTGTTSARDLDVAILAHTKTAWRERFAIDHYVLSSDDTGVDSAGYHKMMRMIDDSSAEGVSGAGVGYSNGGELYWAFGEATGFPLTSGGSLVRSRVIEGVPDEAGYRISGLSLERDVAYLIDIDLEAADATGNLWHTAYLTVNDAESYAITWMRTQATGGFATVGCDPETEFVPLASWYLRYNPRVTATVLLSMSGGRVYGIYRGGITEGTSGMPTKWMPYEGAFVLNDACDDATTVFVNIVASTPTGTVRARRIW